MLDDKDEFGQWPLDSLTVKNVRSLRRDYLKRLENKDYGWFNGMLGERREVIVFWTEQNVLTWLADANAELDRRGVCRECGRMRGCSC